MRFFIDASCPRLLVTRLREYGHEVEYAVDLAPETADEVWAERATRLEQVIVTQDYDFGELAEAGRAPFGVVQIAPGRGPLAARIDRAVEAILERPDLLAGAITTIEPGRTRRRRLGQDADST